MTAVWSCPAVFGLSTRGAGSATFTSAARAAAGTLMLNDDDTKIRRTRSAHLRCRRMETSIANSFVVTSRTDDKAHRHRIHAIAQAGRLRPVIKYVPHVRVAKGA